MKCVIVTMEWCLEHGMAIPAQARKSADGRQVILGEGRIGPVLSGKEGAVRYLYGPPGLGGIAGGPEWTVPEKGRRTE